MKKPILHWTHGGTGLTNFRRRELDIYEKAIKLYGKGDVFVVKEPFETEVEATDDYSLHKVGGSGRIGFLGNFQTN